MVVVLEEEVVYECLLDFVNYEGLYIEIEVGPVFEVEEDVEFMATALVVLFVLLHQFHLLPLH